MNALAIYTVYHNPRDYPGEFVVRRSLLLYSGMRVDPSPWARGATLAEVRAAIPLGVVPFSRQPSDDPAIVECWL